MPSSCLYWSEHRCHAVLPELDRVDGPADGLEGGAYPVGKSVTKVDDEQNYLLAKIGDEHCVDESGKGFFNIVALHAGDYHDRHDTEG